MHGGYGAAIAGHAHPAIVAAVVDRVRRGTHFAQPTEDAIWIAGRALPPLRAAAVAVRQLRHRSHDGRRPSGPRAHRARPDHQGRGLLSRPPRLGAGLGAARGRRGRPARHGRTRCPATPASPPAIRDLVIVVPFNDLGAVARALAEHRGQVAGDDPRAGDDERRHHPARRRLPRRHPRPAARRRRVPDLRRGEDRLHHGAGRRHRAAAAWCPTWCVWPRRSAAASRSRRSAAPRR